MESLTHLFNTSIAFTAIALIGVLVVVFLALYWWGYKGLRSVKTDVTGYNALVVESDRLQQDVAKMTEVKQQLTTDLASLHAERQSLEKVRTELAQLQQQCLSKEQLLRNLARDEAEVRFLLGRKQELEAETERLKQGIAQLPAQEQALQALEAKRDLLLQQVADYEKTSLRHQELIQRVEAIKTGIAKLEEQRTAALRESTKVSQDLGNAQRQIRDARQDLDTLQEKKAKLEAGIVILASEKETLEALLAEKRQEMQELSTGSAQAETYAELFERDPDALRQNDLKGKSQDTDERRKLAEFRNYLAGKNLYFHDRVLNAFHTSLKCQNINPLTVLAGVSGTGKTLLPVKYAEFFGLHLLVLPVQPRWDSPQDLFGFYNYLEKKFKATDLSRCLVRMDPYNYVGRGFDWAHERMLMVLLDEMNLARTEYYFSEFLSKLELRRQVNNPGSAHARSKAEIQLDGGRLKLWVPNNVLFVGTMNEDESTQTLSDKVLDRSNVLRFGKPAALDSTARASKAAQTATTYLPGSTWQRWQRTSVSPNDDLCLECMPWINRLNDAMEKIGRPFGYRVTEAMLLYVANYPDMTRHKDALADQVEQKILPKLRGIDVQDGGARQCLDGVEQVIGELGDKALAEAFQAARKESNRLGLFGWRGVSRVQS